MSQQDEQHAEHLRAALLKVSATGQNGFEGLIATMLESLTGQPFRLAISGSQRGRDGDSAYDQGATYFEAKRYDNSIPAEKVKSKILDLANDDTGQVDLWVLVATVEVGAQLADSVRNGCSKHGIGVYILDWSNTGIGSLVIALAAAKDKSKAFLKDKITDAQHTHLVSDACTAIDHFAAHDDFENRLRELRNGLDIVDIGLGQAKAKNYIFLRDIFENKVRARGKFGQPLAPLAPESTTQSRITIENQLQGAFTGKPASDIYAIIGDEGTGKSWLAVNTWLQCKSRSTPCALFIFLTSDELRQVTSEKSFEQLLIQKLIYQTGDRETVATKNRWQRRLKMWKNNSHPENVRLTVIVDGLNQASHINWSRCIDHIALELKEMGGCLVITTRTAHWNRIQSALTASVQTILVAQWTHDECKAILRNNSLNPDILNTNIFETLRNPRILGIALSLLEKSIIESINELSVERLMFEHMRQAENTGTAQLDGEKFKNILRGLAQKILDRMAANQSDDLYCFDTEQMEQLNKVATCQFFSAVPHEPSLYKINKEGLDLALGLWLVSVLEKEFRSNRDIREKIDITLEPLSTLDEAARLVFTTLQIAFAQDSSLDVKIALVEHFILMQNLPETESEVFAALTKKSPESFLCAAEYIHTKAAHVPNAHWLLYALLTHRDKDNVWDAIRDKVKTWLPQYSLAPERMMFKSFGRDSQDKIDAERAEREEELATKVKALTPEESVFCNVSLTLYRHWTYDALNQFAFFLLAGKPLQEFASSFVSWAFANSLSPSFHAPKDEFLQLVRFNAVDWHETRDALLNALAIFQDDNTSDTGKWARVNVLHATGAMEDAEEAKTLAEWLTRNREKFEGWSLIEKYCATDPCDPTSAKPDNVGQTAHNYRNIDTSTLGKSLNQTSESHFFDMARTGVVRFCFDDAIAAHRALAEYVLNRAGLDWLQGIRVLSPHSATLTPDVARQFVSTGLQRLAEFSASNADTADADDRMLRDEKYAAQLAILLALPHLTANEQLQVIKSMRTQELLCRILDATSPADADKIEEVLEYVCVKGDEEAQLCVLGVVRYSKPELTPRALDFIASLTNSADEIIRFFALGICAVAKYRPALERFVATGWKALDENSPVVSWNGSYALRVATQSGLINPQDACGRMSFGHLGFAAMELGQEVAQEIALCIQAALKSSLGVNTFNDLPEMVFHTSKPLDVFPQLPSLDEPLPQNDIGSQMRRASESEKEFYARQERAQGMYKKLVHYFKLHNAYLIHEDITLDGMFAILDAAPELAESMLEDLLGASDFHLRLLRHSALQITLWNTVCKKNDKAEELLRKLLDLSPVSQRLESMTSLPEEVASLWRFADNHICGSICRERLFTLTTDKEISLEVLAALRHKQVLMITQGIDELLASAEPAKICRALTIAGFCDDNIHAENVLQQFTDAKGFIGGAAKIAQGSYMRNQWARHWFDVMHSTADPVDFWQASVLFTKVVDVRFSLWGTTASGDIFKKFWHTISNSVQNRIKKLHDKRQKKLFGDKQPASIFLS